MQHDQTMICGILAVALSVGTAPLAASGEDAVFPDAPRTWGMMVATYLVAQLERSRTSLENAMRGEVVADDGSFVEISTDRLSELQLGDLLEATCILSSGENGYLLQQARAALFCVARLDDRMVLAKVIEKRVAGSLAAPKYRVQYARGQRLPVRVDSAGSSASYGAHTEYIRSELLDAIAERLEQSLLYAIVNESWAPEGSIAARRGVAMLDNGSFAYVSLNLYDGVHLGDQVEATYTRTSRNNDGRYKVGPAMAASLKTVRSDTSGSLCTVAERHVSMPLDDPRLRAHVRVVSQCGNSSSENDSHQIRPPRSCILQLCVQGGGGADLAILVTVTLAGVGVAPVATAKVHLNPETLRPMAASTVTIATTSVTPSGRNHAPRSSTSANKCAGQSTGAANASTASLPSMAPYGGGSLEDRYPTPAQRACARMQYERKLKACMRRR